MPGAAETAPDAGHGHAVAFYEDDGDLTTAVARFIGDSLEAGGTAVVVATPEHRVSIREAVDSRRSVRTEQYVELDATATLSLLSVDGVVDSNAFATTLDPLLRATAGGGPVHVFGEMVALLWDHGLVAQAIDLETLWNEAGHRHNFHLLCAYPIAAIEGEDNLGPGKRICDQHSRAVNLGEPLTGVVDGSSVTRTFVPDADALRHVRRFVKDTLDSWGLAARGDDVQLIASELGTNSTRHAESPFRMTLTRQSQAITLAVRDASHDHPLLRASSPAEIGGRGLALVAHLADAWGTTIEPDGKTVWAEMRL